MNKPRTNYINRELSWLEFNHRVLEEALDESVPVLDRLKFLAITASNLDEFFMVRVGGLRMLIAERITRRDPAGMTPARQLEAVCDRVRAMVGDQYTCFNEQLIPRMAEAGIGRLLPEELSRVQLKFVQHIFENEISATVTPMAVDATGPFPLLTGLSLYMAVRLKPAQGKLKPRFALIPLGINASRFVAVPTAEGNHRYILLEDIVSLFVDRLFPGEPVMECVPLRITRNADMSVREDRASDLLAQMEKVLDERKQSDTVRLEVQAGVSRILLSFLQRRLDIGEKETYRIPGPLQLSDFMDLAGLEGHDELRYEAWPPQPSPQVDPTVSMFKVLSEHDVLLYHPYDSFEPIVKLINEAASDPDVLAIKQVLYRTSRNSPIISALKRAAEGGKYITAIVELKARFDEARNIEWARELEQAGVQVIYGVKGYKTHAKVAIVVRREPRGIVRYLHFGTGNYNESTARMYTDVSYMTCDEELGADASSFFNAITGYSQPQKFRKLAAAPIGLREHLLQWIESEAERKRHGQKALIMAKMNSLVDTKIIEALYRASQAGVKVMLNVRGICCLRPGIKGLSENITVVSIVDRFLEHSRIFYFHHGGEQKLFISSADWMPRNLVRRVELMVPVDDQACRRRLRAMLEISLCDKIKGRMLKADGTYVRTKGKGRRKNSRSQEALYRYAQQEIAQAHQRKRTRFEPHRPPQQGA